MSIRAFRRIAPGLLREVSRGMSKKGSKSVSSLFKPAPVRLFSNPEESNVGEELASKIQKSELLRVLNEFQKQPEVKELSREKGLDSRLFQQAFISFRKTCLDSPSLDPDLHIICSDLIRQNGHVTDIFPYFMKHAKTVFPHLDCMDELQKISDLRLPANWYPEARSIERKIIFHAGPTNSGKTYHAMKAFTDAESGVYCGPLKMLAVEVFQKTNLKGTSCDLVTGEDRQYANPEGPSKHLASTVEMVSTTDTVDVAVIDEIQMMRDSQRGWAWTRALLGIPAKEVHLCGEECALNLVQEIMHSLGEEVIVKRYKRLTPLEIQNKPLLSIQNLEPGDCIVCFNKNDIYSVSLAIEKMGKECAVIYGALPPGTKAMQAEKFNDPKDPCKILVATDAIGMGLNLSIRRIIFYSLTKPNMNEQGQREVELISVSQALQIAGRAGRYGTTWETGFVTTMRRDDLPKLQELLRQKPDVIEKAGLHPTADQIELFAYHLPHATLSNLVDIFLSLSQMDSSQYFMCNIDSFKSLADMIQHVQLPLRARYVFCCAPINLRMPFVCTMFLKYARQYSRNEPLTWQWLCGEIEWPLKAPRNIKELVHLEEVYDVMDLYLWLSYRFPDLFPEQARVHAMEKELDLLIQKGVLSLTRLLQSTQQTTEVARNSMEDMSRNDAKTDLSAAPIGRLTDKLLQQGLITAEELRILQEEWQKQTPRTTGRRKK